MPNQLPHHLIPGGASPVFTQDTLPDALQAEHTLAPGHWGVLNVLEGSLRFVNLETGEERLISAPDLVTIHPGLPHRVALEGRLHCRIDFYREPPADTDDSQDSTNGESVDSAAETGNGEDASVQAEAGAVKKAFASIPRVVRRIARKEDTGSDTLPEEVMEVSAERLKDEAMKCYLGVLVWLVNTDDDLIDEREMCEIHLLATQRQCNREVRKTVREHLEDPHGLDARTLIDDLLEHAPEAGTAEQLGLKCALMKDAIRVQRSTTDGPVRGEPGIRRLAETLELTDKQVEFIEVACEQDEKILRGNLSDRDIMKAAKDLTAKAGAAGVPLGVIYVGGSVTGLSAAGITSGLATLGMGGVLGLSAMVTGIGVAIIIGGTVYQGVRWVLGRSERDRASLRELMLQEILRTHQQAIINLGEDMSHFGERIAQLAGKTEKHRAAIDMLSREVTLLSRSAAALTRLGKRASDFECDLQKAAEHAER